MRATASFRPRVRAGFGATVVMAALLVGVLLSASAAVGSGDGVVADAVNLEKLFAADGASGDYFGYAVSIDEDTCVIGARWDDDDGPDSGSAYVFTREGDTWSEQAKLTASDGASGDYFGYSVSIDGDTCVIGAHGDDDEGLNSGSAYVFTREGDTWNEQAKLTASDGAAHDCFGFSVSVDADSCLVGADGDDDRGTSSGSAYVFTREGDTWSEQTKLVASDGASGDYFGYSVSIDGDTCVIGAHGDDDHGASSGSAYAFTRKKGTWSEQAKLVASDGASGDRFGYSVSIDGDTCLIGAHGDDDKGASSGSAYAFTRKKGTWSEQTKLVASDGASGDCLGYSVSIDGDTCVVGALGDDGKGSNAGSAYVWSANAIPAVDHSAGFVTGGGSIDSPAGAYAADPTLVGRATFGFVSKHKKGASVPEGSTEFQFKAGDLNFHSNTQQGLVVNEGGTNAQLKGSGTINGELAPNDEEYKFMIWAGDGETDTFRMKIWYEVDDVETAVYDNGVDQAIGGGSIVVHD